MRIKEVIKEKGFTIDAVAKALGKSKSGMSQIVNNDNTPPQTLRSIAKVIGCNMTDFFLDEDVLPVSSVSKENEMVCPYCGKPFKLHITIDKV